MSPVTIHHPHVEVGTGTPVVRGTKIPVCRLWAWHIQGVTIETLVKRYPRVGPAAILDALSFAYDNRAMIDDDIERRCQALEETMRGKI